MKSSRLFALGTAGVCALAFPSCSKMSTLSKAATGKMSDFSHKSLAAFDGLMPSRVPVVQVRQKDLKDLPLGHERALAFQEKQHNSWSSWFFQGPVNFKEPVLPDTSAESNGSLLPLLPVKHRSSTE